MTAEHLFLIVLLTILGGAVLAALYAIACDVVTSNVAAAFDMHADEALAMVEEER